MIVDQPIQHFEVSQDNSIIVVTGPELDIFRSYGSYYDSYRYWMRQVDIEGNEIGKIELEKPMVSPFVITPEGKIVLFSDGCLLSYANKDQPPLSGKGQDVETCSSFDGKEEGKDSSLKTDSYSSVSKWEQVKSDPYTKPKIPPITHEESSAF